jgi:hypothetical protein
MGTEVKRPGREAHYSPHPCTEVKNVWSYTSTPPMRFHDVVLKQEIQERTNKSAQLTTNQRAETALRRATTGINTRLDRPPDPHQLNNPDDEDRDGLRNVGVYESRTTLPG